MLSITSKNKIKIPTKKNHKKPIKIKVKITNNFIQPKKKKRMPNNSFRFSLFLFLQEHQILMQQNKKNNLKIYDLIIMNKIPRYPNFNKD